MRYKARSPGSVTLFFEIVDSEEIHRMGSRGVGVTVEPGALTEVEEGEERYLLNGKDVEGEIQKIIAEKYGFRGTVRTNTSLPVSQGFGMSGAIALSTSLALAAMYKKTYFHAAKIAHEAELVVGGGLGDVASEFEGGFTFREVAGIQPYGKVDRIHYAGKIKLVVFGEKIDTKSIIQNNSWKQKIKWLGKNAMKKFATEKTFENALSISRDFAMSLGFASQELEDFIVDCENSTMALFGNSAIVFGECGNYHDGVVYPVKLGHRALILS